MIKIYLDEYSNFIKKERKPMFTQQHYRAIAEVIHQRRLKIKQTAGSVDLIQLTAVADLQKDLIDLFKADNAKFNPLLFIAASSKDLA